MYDLAWQQWLLVVNFLLNSFIVILYVGKRREVITPLTAAISVLLNFLLILAVTSI